MYYEPRNCSRDTQLPCLVLLLGDFAQWLMMCFGSNLVEPRYLIRDAALVLIHVGDEGLDTPPD